MDPAISWLVKLGIDQGLFTLDQAKLVRHTVGEKADLLTFAQQLIDDAHVDDDLLGDLEKLAGIAHASGANGAPAGNPWSDEEPAPVVVETPLAAPGPAPGPTAAPAPAPLSPPPAERAQPRVATASAAASMVPIEAGELDFADVANMDDDTLAQKFRGLLVLCGEEGVSDLHLTAGAAPFVRNQRALTPISEHVLTEEEAMRLNTVLLAPHQAKIYLERKDYDYALALDASHRYRVNLMFHKDGS